MCLVNITVTISSKCICMSYMDTICNIIMHFSDNQDLTPMTPNDHRLIFDLINGVESLKLVHIYA